jgi:arginine deiminase
MLSRLAIGVLGVVVLVLGVKLFGQGMELSKARKAHDRVEQQLVHQKEVSMTLARDLVVVNKSARSDRTKAAIDKQVARAINGINKNEKVCDFDADKWATDIRSVRTAAGTEDSTDTLATTTQDPN